MVAGRACRVWPGCGDRAVSTWPVPARSRRPSHRRHVRRRRATGRGVAAGLPPVLRNPERLTAPSALFTNPGVCDHLRVATKSLNGGQEIDHQTCGPGRWRNQENRAISCENGGHGAGRGPDRETRTAGPVGGRHSDRGSYRRVRPAASGRRARRDGKADPRGRASQRGDPGARVARGPIRGHQRSGAVRPAAARVGIGPAAAAVPTPSATPARSRASRSPRSATRSWRPAP